MIYNSETVYLKRQLIKGSLQPRWKGPYQVLLRNPCTANLKGVDAWIHVSHLKRAFTSKISRPQHSVTNIRLLTKQLFMLSLILSCYSFNGNVFI